MEWAIWFHVWGFLFKKRSSIQTQSCTDYIISILLKNVYKDSGCKSPTLLCMTYIDQRPSASYSCGRRYHTETCKGRFKCDGECASSGCQSSKGLSVFLAVTWAVWWQLLMAGLLLLHLIQLPAPCVCSCQTEPCQQCVTVVEVSLLPVSHTVTTRTHPPQCLSCVALFLLRRGI